MVTGPTAMAPEIATLRALGPFAKFAPHIAMDYEDGDHLFHFVTDEGRDVVLKVGDFRAAAAAMEGKR